MPNLEGRSLELERNVSVRTPESISFYYELAGLGSRFLAVAVDFMVQFLFSVAVVLLAVWAAPGAEALAKLLGLSQQTLSAVVIAIAIIFFFLVYTGYFVAFETLWNGRTPGKRLIGIRVVRDGGYPVTFMDSVIRNFVRVIESALVYVPSIVSALISSENKRLGDLAAGTIVIRDRPYEVTDTRKWLSPSADSSVAAPPIAGLDRLSEDEYSLTVRYVSRSHMLAPDAAQETASRIAHALRPKLGPEAARYTDHELLVLVAANRPR
jgi:uncharacterized RDD family membrane protein YckC